MFLKKKEMGFYQIKGNQIESFVSFRENEREREIAFFIGWDGFPNVFGQIWKSWLLNRIGFTKEEKRRKREEVLSSERE